MTERCAIHRLLSVLTVSLLVPVVFLMAVVVFYGCLLLVLSYRLRLQFSAPREAGTTAIDAGRRHAPLAPAVVPQERTAVRFLIVVSRQDPARYQELHRIFGGHRNTEVIFDRRRPGSRSHPVPPLTPRPAERRQRHVDEDLRLTGWAMLRLTG